MTDALRRSWHLTTDNILRTAAVLVIGSLVTAIVSAVLVELAAIVFVDIVATGTGLGLDGAVAGVLLVAVVTVLLAPFVSVLMAVLYHDLKVRRDD